MRQLRLSIRAMIRVASSDVAVEGEHLTGLVRSALERGRAVPVAVVVRPERTDLLDLRPAAAAGLHVNAFVAGLSRSEVPGAGPVVAVGIAGTFRHRTAARSEEPIVVPVALAFLEWPDCRWFHWQGLLEGNSALREDTELVRSAEAGDPMPAGLGRWWSLGRRKGMQVQYTAGSPEAPAIVESPLIH